MCHDCLNAECINGRYCKDQGAKPMPFLAVIQEAEAEAVREWLVENKISNCCGARVLGHFSPDYHGLCSDCKEWAVFENIPE